MEEDIEAANDYGHNHLGIRRTTWAIEDRVLRYSQRGFDGFLSIKDTLEQPHTLDFNGVTTLRGDNDACACCEQTPSLYINEAYSNTLVTWADLWKAIDLWTITSGCDHTFIEGIGRKGDTIVVSFGS